MKREMSAKLVLVYGDGVCGYLAVQEPTTLRSRLLALRVAAVLLMASSALAQNLFVADGGSGFEADGYIYEFTNGVATE